MDVSTTRQKKLSRDDWVRAAFAAMADGGLGAIRVDVLAKGLGVSRGSFYWHFTDREDLVKATLLLWEQEITTKLIERLSPIADPKERMRQIVSIALLNRSRIGLHLAVHANADDPLVAPVLHRATTARLEFLTRIFRDLGHGEQEARRNAVLIYTIYLGWHELPQTLPGLAPELDQTKDQFFEKVMSLLG